MAALGFGSKTGQASPDDERRQKQELDRALEEQRKFDRMENDRIHEQMSLVDKSCVRLSSLDEFPGISASQEKEGADQRRRAGEKCSDPFINSTSVEAGSGVLFNCNAGASGD